MEEDILQGIPEDDKAAQQAAFSQVHPSNTPAYFFKLLDVPSSS